jgi:glutamate transport system permease protein
MSAVLFDVPGPRARRRHRILSLLTIAGVLVVLGLIGWRFASTGQFAYELWEVFLTPDYISFLAEGLYYTVLAAVMAIAGALVVGMLLGIGKLSDHAWVRWPCWLFVEFFRAVPLYILITYLWALYKFQIELLAPLVIGLILYNGSVLAETVRAGINAVPKGQVEAAYALGMRKSAVMRIVQLPQAIKIMTPSIISQCIVALKDTSLGYIIVAPGLTYAGRQIWREFDNHLQVALVLGLIYILLNTGLELLGRFAQRRLTESRAVPADVVTDDLALARR